MRDRPTRRYPPTIYPPRSQALADYRDGWDTGYGIARAHGIANALLHALNDDDTPRSHGLIDGAVAWWRREQKAMATEKSARRAALEVRRRAKQ